MPWFALSLLVCARLTINHVPFYSQKLSSFDDKLTSFEYFSYFGPQGLSRSFLKPSLLGPSLTLCRQSLLYGELPQEIFLPGSPFLRALNDKEDTVLSQLYSHQTLPYLSDCLKSWGLRSPDHFLNSYQQVTHCFLLTSFLFCLERGRSPFQKKKKKVLSGVSPRP